MLQKVTKKIMSWAFFAKITTVTFLNVRLPTLKAAKNHFLAEVEEDGGRKRPLVEKTTIEKIFVLESLSLAFFE